MAKSTRGCWLEKILKRFKRPACKTDGPSVVPVRRDTPEPSIKVPGYAPLRVPRGLGGGTRH